MNEAELFDAFRYHPPHRPEVGAAHDAVRHMLLGATTQILQVIKDVTGKPTSRETALFVTKMREAMMWANASIAINQ